MKLILLFLLVRCAALGALGPTNPPLRITLAWDAPADPSVVGYRIYQGVVSRNYTNMIEVMGRDNLSASFLGIPLGMTNYFAATAFNVPLESDFSVELGYFPPSPPAPPAGLIVTNILLKLRVESAPSPAGPWLPLTTLGTEVTAPGYFRGIMSIEKPPPAKTARRVVLRSPKNSP